MSLGQTTDDSTGIVWWTPAEPVLSDNSADRWCELGKLPLVGYVAAR